MTKTDSWIYGRLTPETKSSDNTLTAKLSCKAFFFRYSCGSFAIVCGGMESSRQRGVHRANKTVGVCRILAHNNEVLLLNKCNLMFIRSMK